MPIGRPLRYPACSGLRAGPRDTIRAHALPPHPGRPCRHCVSDRSGACIFQAHPNTSTPPPPPQTHTQTPTSTERKRVNRAGAGTYPAQSRHPVPSKREGGGACRPVRWHRASPRWRWRTHPAHHPLKSDTRLPITEREGGGVPPCPLSAGTGLPVHLRWYARPSGTGAHACFTPHRRCTRCGGLPRSPLTQKTEVHDVFSLMQVRPSGTASQACLTLHERRARCGGLPRSPLTQKRRCMLSSP
jgi:hypothetical protein